MLAQVLLPGRNAELLNESIRSLSVAVQLPARPPCPESRPAELPHRLQEGRLTLRRDGVVDGDQDRSAVGLGVEGQPRVGPVDGQLGVEVAGLRHPPEDASEDPGQHHNSRQEDRRLQADSVSGESPEQCTSGL